MGRGKTKYTYTQHNAQMCTTTVNTSPRIILLSIKNSQRATKVRSVVFLKLKGKSQRYVKANVTTILAKL